MNHISLFFLSFLLCFPIYGQSSDTFNYCWKGTVRSPDGHCIFYGSAAHVQLTEELMRRVDTLPQSRVFNCKSKHAKLIRSVHEENDIETFFFGGNAGGGIWMFSMADLEGDYSRVQRDPKNNNAVVNGASAIVSQVVDRNNSELFRWSVGWDYIGALATFTIENAINKGISKSGALELANSIQCERRPR